MTPFQVYLLMQADKICFIAGLVSVLAGVAFVASTICRYASGSGVTAEDTQLETSGWREWQAIIKVHRWVCAIFFPALLIAIFMPNTKAIATMVVLPKITSPSALNAMGEKGQQLYDLATKALGQMVNKNNPEEKKVP